MSSFDREILPLHLVSVMIWTSSPGKNLKVVEKYPIIIIIIIITPIVDIMAFILIDGNMSPLCLGELILGKINTLFSTYLLVCCLRLNNKQPIRLERHILLVGIPSELPD